MILGGLAVLIIGLGGGYYLGTQQIQPVVKESMPSVSSVTKTNEAEPEISEALIGEQSTIDIQFELPNRLASKYKLNKVIFEPNDLQTGTLICWELIDLTSSASSGNCKSNSYFSIQATSTDYTYPRGGSFLDSQGFIYEEGKYRVRFVGQQLSDVFAQENITKIANPNGVEMIRIKQMVDPDEGPTINATLNNRIGVLINTNNVIYPGVAIIFETENGLTDEEIDQILQTFRFI